MSQATILPDPTRLGLVRLSASETGITAVVATTAAGAPCPLCGGTATRLHSRYVRTVADLPWHGVAFRLQLRVRRFFCERASCPRVIFTERLPTVVAPYARRTVRLAEVLQFVGGDGRRRGGKSPARRPWPGRGEPWRVGRQPGHAPAGSPARRAGSRRHPAGAQRG